MLELALPGGASIGMIGTASSMPFQFRQAEVRSFDFSPTLSDQLAKFRALWGSDTATQSSSASHGVVLYVDDQRIVVEPETASQEAGDTAVTAQPVLLRDRLDEIKNRFSLSITQMAELFGVTRKAVYDWYEGAEPRSLTTSRIEVLLDVAEQLPNGVDLRRLKTVWNIPVSGRSFRSVFCDDSLDTENLRSALLAKLHELLPRMAATTSPAHKASVVLGEGHLSEFDRRADIT